MARDDQQPRQLGVGTRLGAQPSPALVTAFGAELRYAHVLYEGVSYADLAHVLMLLEEGIIPAEAGAALLDALVALHDAGLAALPLDARWGDLYNNRDAELQRRLGAKAGWLHAGRARREALTVGWLIHLRAASRELLRATVGLVTAIADLAERHAGALMPDFTYLQHAHPTTLGHFLLGFAYPVWRDAARLAREIDAADHSPAGSASTNGSRLPLNRERLRELLGFGGMTVHTRDAMWRSDIPINLMAVVVSLTTTADRLAEELQIWATAEFGFVTLADAHCRTSVIMPHKRNPYALTFIRGTARDLDGKLVSVVTTNQTPSGQIDNRNAAYEIVPQSLAAARDAVVLLAEVLAQATFQTARMRDAADAGCTYGTELTDLLMLREGIDSRTAHEIVGAVVAGQVAAPADRPPLDTAIAQAFRAATGRAPSAPPAELLPELTAESIVRHRIGAGGCAPDAVRQMSTSLRASCAQMMERLEAAAASTGFPALLRRCVADRLGRTW